ncbi:MAG: GIY-YIG nuclease family protein [Candidatus Roizmanbacteria bacterium]|uniref:GIY-YIG domain-containing protein n=2 Tax=Candidatus Roizmaniibacteriota TaxID=1752723 RepID=A0A2M8EX87_9BACT|nr:GIY-YIG nuclease family protein [Candidatus Roizmanbacteria bacterium]PIZ66435.1 MAG: hypothetical protein COY15_01145 [Candidatus Roizmanbacteria bacterium CG_4_10_14_0_2_um_filter_39_12]PJC30494.1 MAG: hypothetical protein CO051_05390 [Candidatus Roizmanbacteria bacterium CG_4_9_14_0_2_um_filter_39_13]PJE62011.1 MAG: hypothetical protein COU87_01525 [Candidatus Roizmanbacteria bacterium CG10_big_fil_rev_8_21_14_0_10_39_12]
MKKSAVYILANKRNGTLYIGVTADLVKRIWQHKNKLVSGFSSKYDLHMLIYYEPFDNIEHAISREKQLKAWKRKWKLALIESMNPDWNDLYELIK